VKGNSKGEGRLLD